MLCCDSRCSLSAKAYVRVRPSDRPNDRPSVRYVKIICQVAFIIRNLLMVVGFSRALFGFLLI